MKISFESGFYLSANVVVGALNAYKTPYRFEWLTVFAAGILIGTIRGGEAFTDAELGYQPGVHDPKAGGDEKVKKKAVQYLLGAMPGFFTTAINGLALAVITESAPLLEPYGSRYKPYISGVSALALGYSLGHLFCIHRLRNSQNPYVQELIDNAEI